MKLYTVLIWLWLKLYKVVNKVEIESSFPFILDSEREVVDNYSI